MNEGYSEMTCYFLVVIGFILMIALIVFAFLPTTNHVTTAQKVLLNDLFISAM